MWQNTEVDALFKLAAAGVRVPRPYVCLDGVLLMELITDEEGNVAPRLNDVALSAEQAVIDHGKVIRYVVRMLCAGLIHGDLSEFNVLVDEQGPVIDLPQVVDAAANNQAKAMLGATSTTCATTTACMPRAAQDPLRPGDVGPV